MSELTNSKQRDILTTQENAENNHNKNSNLHERIKIEGTPFTLIKNTYEDESTLWFMVMGDYRITEPTETEEEQIKILKDQQWNILLTMIVIAIKKETQNPVLHEM